MKRTEIATIILVFGVSCLVAYFGANAIIGKKIKHEATVEQTKLVVDDVKNFIPSKRIFNDNAINPTVEVFVQNQGDATATSSSVSPQNSDNTSAAGASSTINTTGNNKDSATSPSSGSTVTTSPTTTNKSEK